MVAPSPKTALSDLERIKGVWHVIGGSGVPPKVEFTGNKIRPPGGGLPVSIKYTLHPEKNPKGIELTLDVDSKEPPLHGIYAFENQGDDEILRILVSPPGKAQNEQRDCRGAGEHRR